MFGIFKKWRRERLYKQPLPAEWKTIIQNNVPYSRRLPSGLQKKLNGLIQIFIHEKSFEGCGGLQMSDEIRLTISAQACILVLGTESKNIFPSLRSVLVYPNAYFAPVEQEEEGGIVVEGEEYRLGEAWSRGHIVLAWDEVQKSASDIHDGYNLVFHEFAHHLDYDYGATDVISEHNPHSQFIAWARVLSEEYNKLVQDIEDRHQTLIDEYGAVNMAEFFAVATETFFEQPRALRDRHPKLYEQLAKFYKQDPASYRNLSNRS